MVCVIIRGMFAVAPWMPMIAGASAGGEYLLTAPGLVFPALHLEVWERHFDITISRQHSSV